MRNPLLDKDFLKQLDEQHNREIYAKIVALNLEEHPVEEITGKVTGGSLNVDGSSAVRRSCSLTMVAQNVNISDYYWGLTSKFKLEIGLKNFINNEYPDIIWFPQGTYVITGFNTSQSINNFDISIQGRDKMALLNGELGGIIGSLSADFGTLEEVVETVEADGTVTKETVYTDIPIKDIIMDVVNHYGKEPFHNIVINDLDDYGLELLDFIGDSNVKDGEAGMYLAVDTFNDEVTQIFTDPTTKVKEMELQNGEYVLSPKDPYDIKKIPYFDPRATLNLGSAGGAIEKTRVKLVGEDGAFSDSIYTIINVEPGQTCGYRLCDLVYAGNLVANVGDSVTSVLDNIIAMLGDFEYFYDLDGRFVFQRKASTTYVSWNNIQNTTDEEQYAENAALTEPWEYIFEGGKIINSFSNNPNLANVKNDFSIWGTREGVSGTAVPVHMRYAIDKKPVYYKTIDGAIYVANKDIYQQLFEDKRNEIIEEEIKAIKGYVPQRTLTSLPVGLDVPSQNADGSWVPGWWHIADWYDYYYKLKDEYPTGTMKWYAYNGWEGCIPKYKVPGYENDKTGNYIWLLTVKADGTISFGHNGSGSPAKNPVKSTFYSSSKATQNDSGRWVISEKVKTDQTKMMYYPFAGCNDDHTFEYFYKVEMANNNSTVYFYNPQFPDSTYEEAIKDAVDKAVEEFERDNQIHYVDWREVIYRMALDYYKYYKYTNDQNSINHRMIKIEKFTSTTPYYHDYYYYLDENKNYVLDSAENPREGIQYFKLVNGDNFIAEVRNNNLNYYPSGYTGYEQYYQDMQGFWGQTYNSKPMHEFMILEPEEGIGLQTYESGEINLTRGEIERSKQKLLDAKLKEQAEELEAKRREYIDNNWAESSQVEHLNYLKAKHNVEYELYKEEQENVARILKHNVETVSQIWVNRYFKKYNPATDIDVSKQSLYFLTQQDGKDYFCRWLDDPRLSWDTLVNLFCWHRNARNLEQIGLCYEDNAGDIEYTITESQPKKDPQDASKNVVDKYGDIIYEDVEVKKKFRLIKSEMYFSGKGELGVDWEESISTKYKDTLVGYTLPEYVKKEELWVREKIDGVIVMTPILDKIQPDPQTTYYYRISDINDYLPLRDLDPSLIKMYYTVDENKRITQLHQRIPCLSYDRLGNPVLVKTPQKDADGNYVKDENGAIV